MVSGLLGPLVTTEAMRRVFADRARLQRMLDFEAALARGEAAAGIIPAPAATAIAARCRAELLDPEELARAAARAGNVAIPLVEALTALVARDDPTAARYVHWGATSQDVQDTALVLQLREALGEVEGSLAELSAVLAELASRHRRTVMAGRTWLQQAQPITFGLKAAGWLSAIERHRGRLAETRARALVLQLGGAVGTLDALGAAGPEVVARVAEELGLAAPDVAWHAQRDRLAEVATTLGLLVGTLGKLAGDVTLLAQTEVAEAAERAAPGRGGSSAMPQKRNPVAAVVVRAAALRAPGLVATMLTSMVQEHERGAGGWHAEWETLPELVALAAGALARVREIVEGLELDPERMRRNLALAGGTIQAASVATALAARLGRPAAHGVVAEAAHRAAAEGRPLREVLLEHEVIRDALTPAELDAALDPERSIGAAEALVDRVLAARRRG
jgi:3-carboxy-cis,cis-muconate cycloisomerase